MNNNNFVVYGFLRKTLDSFYYIGKGRPDRPFCKNKRTIPHPGSRSRIVILYENLEEERALEIEKNLIYLMGRIGVEEWGTLRNISSGGAGLTKKLSESARYHKSMLKEERKKLKRKDWFHPVIGEIYNKSNTELAKEYPEQQLNSVALLKVARGVKCLHKGWRLIKGGKPLPDQKIHTGDWHHPVHGTYKNMTIRQLIKENNLQHLNVESLRKVARGEILEYRGWKLAKNMNFRNKRKVRLYDWYHENYGEIIQKSIREVVETFHDLDLTKKQLYLVSTGKRLSHKGVKLLKNKNKTSRNQKLMENWEHEDYGIAKNCSARELSKMFPELKLTDSSLRCVARGEISNHKGWFLQGKLILRKEDPRGNWYNSSLGLFFNKTPAEMSKIDERKQVRPCLFRKLLEGRGRISRGWTLLKKTPKPKAYKKVESKKDVKRKPKMRSRTLTKTLAITPETHARVSEIREKMRFRTYDDAVRYLMGDFNHLRSAGQMPGEVRQPL